MKAETNKVEINKDDLINLIHWARRYCDGRATYAPSAFNALYKRIRSEYPDLFRCKDLFDNTLYDKGAFFPYAQDGMYNKDTNHFNAIPVDISTKNT